MRQLVLDTVMDMEFGTDKDGRHVPDEISDYVHGVLRDADLIQEHYRELARSVISDAMVSYYEMMRKSNGSASPVFSYKGFSDMCIGLLDMLARQVHEKDLNAIEYVYEKALADLRMIVGEGMPGGERARVGRLVLAGVSGLCRGYQALAHSMSK